MKRLTAILVSVMMLIVMAMPVYATSTDGFVDSVTGQPAPGIVADGDVIGHIVKDGSIIDEVMEGEIVITPYIEKETLSDTAKALLEEAYAKANSEDMELPEALKEILGDNAVAQELFDVALADADVIAYVEEGNAVRFTLDANVATEAGVAVATYVDGQWVMAEDCANNGDGTITVTMEKFGPVAVFVKGEETSEPVGGDEPTAEGDCKICKGFFPYLGHAPIFQDSIFEDTCIICFVIIVVIVCTVGYIVYKKLKNKDDNEQK